MNDFYDTRNPRIPGLSFKEFFQTDVEDPDKNKFQPIDRKDGFWTIVYARDYVIIHVSEGSKLDLNGLIVDIANKSTIHFPLCVMGVTQILVSPKPLSVEYRFADDLAIERDKYRNESMKIKLPDGSMGIITNRLLRKME